MFPQRGESLRQQSTGRHAAARQFGDLPQIVSELGVVLGMLAGQSRCQKRQARQLLPESVMNLSCDSLLLPDRCLLKRFL